MFVDPSGNKYCNSCFLKTLIFKTGIKILWNFNLERSRDKNQIISGVYIKLQQYVGSNWTSY